MQKTRSIFSHENAKFMMNCSITVIFEIYDDLNLTVPFTALNMAYTLKCKTRVHKHLAEKRQPNTVIPTEKMTQRTKRRNDQSSVSTGGVKPISSLVQSLEKPPSNTSTSNSIISIWRPIKYHMTRKNKIFPLFISTQRRHGRPSEIGV